MVYLAERGYRAVAPDLRVYGDTTGAPVNDISKLSLFHLVGDLITLLEAIDPNEDNVFVVAHDWGAIIAWHLCLFRPDKVKALVNLSVHFFPRNPHMNPVEGFKALYGEDHFISRFQVSPCTRDPSPFYFPEGKGLDAIPDAPAALSSWLSEEELDYYASKFEKTGFTGPINYYRALPLDWELTAPWTGAQVKVPTKFIVGDLDLVYHIPDAKEYIHNGGFKKDVPLLEEVVILEGAAHFVNQERPDEISKHIYDFIQKF
ncbi:epoxide hydrolase A-like [Capsicum annuum]|uniref:epoxide hydrolase A-like n=1 Tax=Capsicum annuum TaxID=4072 RepID=UPI001FB0B8E4|nr:epoxide hydrolase A-like [Capsicum annuum]